MSSASLSTNSQEIWLGFKQSRMSRKPSGLIQRFRRHSARIRTAKFSTGCSEFVTGRGPTRPAPQSCQSSIHSQAAARKLATITQPQSSMLRLFHVDVWADPDAAIDLSAIKNLVAVHRLREVSCLYGFTRFEAAPTGADGDIEDIQLSVRGAPISRDADWLPAIEQFGEGIFIHFDEVAIRQWLEKESTVRRHQKLLAGYGHWQKRFVGKAPAYPGTPYVLLHSISHALMAEIALDCGYPASSLKERVYALSELAEWAAISTAAAS